MDEDTGDRPVVRQLRLVVEAEDYEEAVRFYRDALGLPEELSIAGPGGAHVSILRAGRATLEIADPAQKAYIHDIEVGRPAAPRLRLAFEVVDAEDATARLLAAGAELVAPLVETPWRSRNARLAAPAGMQLTIFEELDALDETADRP